MKKIYLSIFAGLMVISLFSQNSNPWKAVQESSFAKSDMLRTIVPDKYQTFLLDLQALDIILKKAPMRFSAQAKSQAPLLALPLADGQFGEFRIIEAPVMHPELAAKYPDIKTYAGWSEKDPTAYARFGISPKGFHAMILSARHNTVFIDVYATGQPQYYICYFKKDFHKDDPFTCYFDQLPQNHKNPAKGRSSLEKAAGDCQFRVYDLALACTGEYAQFHGGTKPMVMAEFNTAMARINGIYERELSVTMVMVPNTDQLIFLNANTDPYTNNSGSTMLEENQVTCDDIIGNANYHIGHVFSTGGGGIAYLQATCNPDIKAGGVTGLSNPTGDPFYVDYVAHEMGHQFGGNHTQNNDCNRNGTTAMEPGSASTIMGYAGVCSPNVQNHSDDYFHAVNLAEMGNHIAGIGGNCAALMPNGNNAPGVSVPATSYNVPVQTPFVLTATGSDPDTANMLTYCWEQMDNEVATMPPTPNNTVGPAFRSLQPTTQPARYFPNLNTILSNGTDMWEVLPAVARQMDFRCTVRDNNPGGGCTDEADLSLNFVDTAGPFLVTQPNTAAAMWMALQMETVTWDVANTDAAPVNADSVDIFLSVDGGLTYPYTLIDGTPNDGSAMVPVPNVTTSEARVMVKGRANVFFDVSDESFPIEMPSLPTFLLSADPTSQSVCSQSMATYLLHFQQVLGFNETVSLSVTGVPPGATAAFQPASVVPPGMVDLLISDLQNVPPGSYTLTVDAVAVSVSRSIEVELVVEQVLTAGPTLISPPDGATDVSPNGVVLQWESFTPTSTYNVQVSLSPDFQVLVHEGTATTNMLDLPPLSEIQVYYWRVEGQNACSQGPYSDPFAFQTGGLSCDTIESTNVPLDIPDDGSGPVVSTLQVNTGQPVSSIYLHTDITHTWVGDLTGSVESPNGTVATLFDRPGHPIVDDGCEGDNMSVGFSDTAPNTADDLESTCPLGDIPVIQGDFQPLQPFSVFNGENSMGEWKLRIEDMFPEFDQGTLQSWFMEICNTQPIPAAVLLNNSPLTVAEGGSAVIANSHLQTQGIPAQTTYLLLSPPTNGTLYLSGAALLIGSSFTQADIDNGSLSYTHDGSPTMADQFAFDVVDDGNHWLHNQLFQINILQNTLSATAALTQPIDCHNANNAIIAATATGGTPPLTYSLNGGTAQSSNVFDQLGAGTYEVTVMDANGFSVTTNAVDIANPPPITLTADVVNDDITANAGGGTGTLQYSIDGVNFQTSPLFENLPNGVYTVTAMDANGCTQDTTAIVAVNTLIVSASQTKAISCFGDSDGEITVQVAGGTPPYEYSLDGVNFQSANVFQNLASGTYTVTVRDADGFVQTDEITLSDPPLLQVSASANGYEVSVAASGGTGTLTYNLNGGAFQSDPQFFPVANGPHNVGVRDENGCEQSVSVEVNVPALGVAGMATQTPSCSDTSDGVITATGTGGVPPYEYSLNGGAFQSNNVFAGLAPGLYMLTIRDSGGFTASSAGITMAAPSPIVVNAQANLDVVTVNVTGGTSPYEYSLDGGPFQSSNIFTGVADGMHTVVVRDANGCEASTDVLVSLPPLNLTATMTQPILCHGDENGIIMLDAAGGVLPYEYSLNGTDFQSSNTFTGLPPGTYQPTVRDASGQVITAPDITLANPDPLQAEGSAFGPLITVEASGGTSSYAYSFDNMPFQNENEYEVLFNGVYPVVVMDENGCTTETEVEVNKPEMVFFTIINASCADSEDGEIIIEGVSGGYPPYLFMLENGPLLPDLHYTGLGTGEYIFLVVDSTGYEWYAHPVLVDAPPPIFIDPQISENDLTVSANGGTEVFQYSIDGGLTFQSDSVFTDLPNGDYTIVVMDENGCTASSMININFTSTHEAGSGLVFEVRPNPGTDIFHLTLPTHLAEGLTIEIFSAIGQLVYTEQMRLPDPFDKTLNLGDLPAGHYQLRLMSGQRWGVKRLVVVK